MDSIWDLLCPYCGNLLKRVPKSKTICPNCGRPIFVRTTIDGQKFEVTEDEKTQIDQKRHRVSSGFGSYLGRKAARTAVRGAAKGCSGGCLPGLFYFFLNI